MYEFKTITITQKDEWSIRIDW